MTLPPLGTRPCFWDNDFVSLQFCSIDLGKSLSSIDLGKSLFAKLALMRAQKSHIDTSSAQVTALWGLFLSRFGKTEGAPFMIPLQRTQ